MKKYIIVFILICCISVIVYGQQRIIPQPLKMEVLNKNPMILNLDLKIVADSEFLSEAKLVAELLNNCFGLSMLVEKWDVHSEDGNIIFIKKKQSQELPKEGYKIEIDDKKCVITASDIAGAYYGGITLSQMIKPAGNETFSLAACQIEDQPRFYWRGLMMDCSRTFLTMEYLKKTIDRMAFYKLNVLHLHLTDDQGWRLEIKKRPLLTSSGATFAEKEKEPEQFNGFYSQEEIKDLIEYAAKRHISIIPEIEVPGHSGAAIHAYPDLSCSGEEVPVYPLFARRSEKPNGVFCTGNPDTYTFFKDVLNEVTPLFPSPYVHLGGDEASKIHWKSCGKCQQKMKELELDNEEFLQRYMMREVGENILQAGKQPIGWDEVMEGDMGRDWIVMAWRDQDKCKEALEKGYKVVMTPTSHMYFDYDYKTISTKTVYAYNPIPKGSKPEDISRILGIQANFWSHIDRWESRIDYQLYPRILALSERAWSDATVNDYEDFKKRGMHHRDWLRYFKIEYNGNDMYY